TEAVLQPPAPGHGVMLTLDRTIQYLAEREIDAAWRRTQARAAMAVVLDPRTGDVLALAIRPTFNPNTFLDVPSREHWRNRAVSGVGLAGESRGQLREPQRWSALSLPTMSIGQEVSVTALQMVAAFGAIANGGVLMQPRLVRAVFDADGRETRRFEPQPVRQVISPETARTLTRLMTQVGAAGTGHNAAVPG